MVNKYRKRVNFGSWYLDTCFSFGVVSPIKRVSNDPRGHAVYKCKIISAEKRCKFEGRDKNCNDCNMSTSRCYWIGYLGKKVPLAMAILVYGVEDEN